MNKSVMSAKITRAQAKAISAAARVVQSISQQLTANRSRPPEKPIKRRVPLPDVPDHSWEKLVRELENLRLMQFTLRRAIQRNLNIYDQRRIFACFEHLWGKHLAEI